MPLWFFWDMTITACITVWSPGPNNIMLLSAASKYGIRKNIKFMLGIWTGSITLMILCGIFCGGLTAIVPGLQPVMKYVGAAYLLYLSYLTGIFLQLVNVKIIVYGLTMFSSFILPWVREPILLLLFAFYLMVLGTIGNLIWAFAGNVLKRFYDSHYKGMNVIMALLLVWCALRVVGVLG